jgi:hypothetical protein
MTEPMQESRAAHARELLAAENDAWLASASEAGEPYLIPLSYAWDGEGMVFSTVGRSVTVRNLRRNRFTRASLPSTRDVVIVDGEIAFFDPATETAAVERFAAHVGWDPRLEPNAEQYAWFRLRPVRVQAWKTAADLPTREVMRDGRWLDGGAGDAG